MRIPAFLTKISPIGEVFGAIGHGTALLEQETAKRNDQLCVSTAGEGLSLWERDYGLGDGTGTQTAKRRARILAAMAGGQTLTKERLEALAVTLGDADRGEAEEDFAHWQVILTALYEGRLPEDSGALSEAVQRLKPAHLEVEVVSLCRLETEGSRSPALSAGVLMKLTGRNGA